MTDSGKRIESVRFFQPPELNFGDCEAVADVEAVDPRRLKSSRSTKTKKGAYKTKEQQDAALENMKRALLAGAACKVAALDQGYTPNAAANFFIRKTGLSMSRYKAEHRNDTHRTTAAKHQDTPATC